MEINLCKKIKNELKVIFWRLRQTNQNINLFDIDAIYM